MSGLSKPLPTKLTLSLVRIGLSIGRSLATEAITKSSRQHRTSKDTKEPKNIHAIPALGSFASLKER